MFATASWMARPSRVLKRRYASWQLSWRNACTKGQEPRIWDMLLMRDTRRNLATPVSRILTSLLRRLVVPRAHVPPLKTATLSKPKYTPILVESQLALALTELMRMPVMLLNRAAGARDLEGAAFRQVTSDK